MMMDMFRIKVYLLNSSKTTLTLTGHAQCSYSLGYTVMYQPPGTQAPTCRATQQFSSPMCDHHQSSPQIRPPHSTLNIAHPCLHRSIVPGFQPLCPGFKADQFRTSQARQAPKKQESCQIFSTSDYVFQVLGD